MQERQQWIKYLVIKICLLFLVPFFFFFRFFIEALWRQFRKQVWEWNRKVYSNFTGRENISILKWNLPLFASILHSKKQADKNNVCSIPEITEILPGDKLKHTEEKEKMNSTHPGFTSYTSQLSATRIPEEKTRWRCFFFWLLLPGPFHIKQLCIKHKSCPGCWRVLHLSPACARLWMEVICSFLTLTSEYCLVICIFSYFSFCRERTHCCENKAF